MHIPDYTVVKTCLAPPSLTILQSCAQLEELKSRRQFSFTALPRLISKWAARKTPLTLDASLVKIEGLAMEIVKLVEEKHAQERETISKSLLRASPKSHRTLLHLGAMFGFNELINNVIPYGADLNQPDASGYTALHYASLYGHGECVDLLVRRGARIEVTDRLGRTARDVAKDACHHDVEKMLKELHLYAASVVARMSSTVSVAGRPTRARARRVSRVEEDRVTLPKRLPGGVAEDTRHYDGEAMLQRFQSHPGAVPRMLTESVTARPPHTRARGISSSRVDGATLQGVTTSLKSSTSSPAFNQPGVQRRPVLAKRGGSRATRASHEDRVALIVPGSVQSTGPLPHKPKRPLPPSCRPVKRLALDLSPEFLRHIFVRHLMRDPARKGGGNFLEGEKKFSQHSRQFPVALHHMSQQKPNVDTGGPARQSYRSRRAHMSRQDWTLLHKQAPRQVRFKSRADMNRRSVGEKCRDALLVDLCFGRSSPFENVYEE